MVVTQHPPPLLKKAQKNTLSNTGPHLNPALHCVFVRVKVYSLYMFITQREIN